MNQQAQFETSDSTVKRLPSRELAADNWMAGRHVQDIIEKFPHVAGSLQKVLGSEVVQKALVKALEAGNDELARALAVDLREGFAGLEGGAPRTIADLDTREMLKDTALLNRTVEQIGAEDVDQRTGGASDYFAQRLTTVVSLIDVVGMMPLSLELRTSLQKEADRLARLLVAFSRAEKKPKQHEDEGYAAVAK